MNRTIQAHEETIAMVCCSKDSRIMLTGDTTGVAKVWPIAELTDTCGKSTPLFVLSDCHDMSVNSADVSPVTAITSECHTKIFDVQWRIEGKLRGNARAIFSLYSWFRNPNEISVTVPGLSFFVN